MFRFWVSSIAFAGVLVALTPLFSQAQTKPDWRYWRTFELQMGLGSIARYIDINSVKRTSNNTWEFDQVDVNKHFKHLYKIRINCRQYTMFFVQGTSEDTNGRTSDITTQMRRMVGLVPDDVKPHCQLFASGDFRRLPRTAQ